MLVTNFAGDALKNFGSPFGCLPGVGSPAIKSPLIITGYKNVHAAEKMLVGKAQ